MLALLFVWFYHRLLFSIPIKSIFEYLDRTSRSLTSRAKSRASRVPIIIIPAAPTSLITMLNATDIL